MRDVQAAVDRLAQFQIDSINVVTRAHFMPLFSRLGPYDPGLLDRAAHRPPRRLFEYWGHAASLIDVTLQPLLRFRMQAGFRDVWGGVRAGGPARSRRWWTSSGRRWRPAGRSAPGSSRSRRCATGATGAGTGRRSRPSWSGCSTAARSPRPGATASSSGSTTCPSGCCPPAVLAAPTPTPEESVVGLVRRAAQALGVASELCLRDYFRTRPAMTRAAIAALVETGELMPVAVQGWEASRTTCGTRRRCRGGSRPGRCSARSTR